MSTTLSPVTPGERSLRLPALALAAAGLGLAVVGAVDHGGPSYVVAAIVTAAWALGAYLVARRLPQRPLALLMGLLALVLGAALYAWAKVDAGEDGFELARSILTALLPAVVLHLAFAVPDGVLQSRAARITVGLGYLAALALGGAVGPEPGDLPILPFCPGRPGRRGGGPGRVPEPLPEGVGRRSGSAAVDRVGRGPGLRRGRPGRPARRSPRLAQPSRHGRRGRHRGRTGRLRGLHGAPAVDRDRPGPGPHGGGGRSARPRRAVYLFVVVGLGRVPEAEERRCSCCRWSRPGLCRPRLPGPPPPRGVANQRVYGERHAPDEALRTFGGRMSRAVPMDELLLQLAESLRKTMH